MHSTELSSSPCWFTCGYAVASYVGVAHAAVSYVDVHYVAVSCEDAS